MWKKYINSNVCTHSIELLKSSLPRLSEFCLKFLNKREKFEFLIHHLFMYESNKSILNAVMLLNEIIIPAYKFTHQKYLKISILHPHSFIHTYHNIMIPKFVLFNLALLQISA
jgi:hypothetical protein